MIFQKLRRELRGRLGLWAAVFQSRQSSSCGARMLARHSWVNQGDKSLRLLGGSHGKCHRKTRHPPGVSVRKHRRRSQESSQPCRSMCQVTAPGLSSAGSGGNLLQQQGLGEHTHNVRRDLKTGALTGVQNRTISPCPSGGNK